MNYLAAAALVMFNLLNIRRKKVLLGKRSQIQMLRFAKGDQRRFLVRLLSGATFWAVLETVVFSVLQYICAPLMNTRFGDLVGTGTNYFGLLITSPILMAAGCAFFREDIRRQVDLVTPAFPLALAVSKIGCWYAGCCTGKACDFLGGKFFPSQLVESAVAVVLFGVLLCVREKVRPGTLYPLYMILYSSVRFFTEFFREEENVFWIFKVYHFQCIGGVLLGFAALNFVLEYNAYLESARKSKKESTSKSAESKRK